MQWDAIRMLQMMESWFTRHVLSIIEASSGTLLGCAVYSRPSSRESASFATLRYVGGFPVLISVHVQE